MVESSPCGACSCSGVASWVTNPSACIADVPACGSPYAPSYASALSCGVHPRRRLAYIVCRSASSVLHCMNRLHGEKVKALRGKSNNSHCRETHTWWVLSIFAILSDLTISSILFLRNQPPVEAAPLSLKGALFPAFFQLR